MVMWNKNKFDFFIEISIEEMAELLGQIEQTKQFHEKNIEQLRLVRSNQHVSNCKNFANEIEFTIVHTLSSMEKLLRVLMGNHTTFPEEFRSKIFAYIKTVVMTYAPK